MSHEPKPVYFGKLQSMFWPIYRHELKKILLIFFTFFFIAFNYNILTCLRISVLVSTPNCGPSSVPFITIFLTLPAAFILTKFYAWLNTKLSRSSIFYIFVFSFLLVYLTFLLFLYPNLDKLALDVVATKIINSNFLPNGYKNVVGIIQYWPVSIFFAASELWGTVILSMLFWGFCNEVTPMEQAKRSYAIFSIGANSAGFFSGYFANAIKIDKFNSNFFYGKTAWDQTLFVQLIAVVSVALVIVAIFFWLNSYLKPKIPDLNLAPKPALRKKNITKSDTSMRKSIKYVIKSKYALSIAIIVVAYNVVYNLSYVLWTDTVQNTLVDVNSINAYMHQITVITSILAFIFALILSGNLIRSFGWTIAALVTPVVCLVTSIGFLSDFLFNGFSGIFMAQSLFGLPISLFFASMQFTIGRACKYTLFDETKEIAFIPLKSSQQRRIKAVVDGIASLVGKSGGSVIYLVLLGLLGSLQASATYVSLLIFILIFSWIIAVVILGELVHAKSSKSQVIEEEISAALS